MPVAVVERRQALPARDRRAVLGGDPLDLGAMGGFPVARIAHHHAVLVERVQVALLSRIPERHNGDSWTTPAFSTTR